MAKKPVTDKINIDELAKLFGMPDYERIEELNEAFLAEARQAGYESAKQDDDPDAEEVGLEAEQEAQTELYNKWYDAVESAAESLFGQHGLELYPAKKPKIGTRSYDLKIVPVISWRNAAEKIRATAEGVGYAYVGNDVDEFLNLGPWTARQAVLEHIGVIKHYPEVYGASSARSLYERAFR